MLQGWGYVKKVSVTSLLYYWFFSTEKISSVVESSSCRVKVLSLLSTLLLPVYPLNAANNRNASKMTTKKTITRNDFLPAIALYSDFTIVNLHTRPTGSDQGEHG